MQILLGALVIEIIILVIAAMIAYYIVKMFVSLSIVFSRITFSLLMALAFKDYFEFASGKANTFIWAAIILTIIMLMSILPRVNGALKFLCTTVISILIISTVTLGVGSLVLGIFGKEFVVTKIMEIVINIVGALIAVGALAEENEMTDFGKFTNKTVINVEKVIAALIYGAAISFMCMSNYCNWEFSGTVQLLIMMAGAAIAYFADKCLIEVQA